MDRRMFLLCFIQGLGSLLLCGRLYQLGGLSHERYKYMSNNNFIKIERIASKRGSLLCSRGKVLAENIMGNDLSIDNDIQGKRAIMSIILQGVHIVNRREFDRFMNTTDSSKVILKYRLTHSEVIFIEANKFRLPSAEILRTGLRFYPQDEVFAHLIGYVRNNTEITGIPIRDNAMDYYGVSGSEEVFDKQLRGFMGRGIVEVNVSGERVRQSDEYPSIPGDNITLTVDSDVQKYAYDKLSLYKAGSVIVADVETGDIISMLSTPAFDPNVFTFNQYESKYWLSHYFSSNLLSPMLFRAVAGQYPPGSIYKVISTIAALKHNFPVDNTIECKGYFYVGQRRYNCWKAHGPVRSVSDALKQSCDTYFYFIAVQLGQDRIAEVAKFYGLGRVSELRFPSEEPGLIPTTKWKIQTLGEPWYRGETLYNIIGQGFTLVTPLQLVYAISRAVTGRYLIPNILASLSGRIKSYTISTPDRYRQYLINGLYGAVNEPGGTAYRRAYSPIENLIIGKTSTAQVRNSSQYERDTGISVENESLPWELRSHGSFICFGPYPKLKYVAYALVEHSGAGSKHAAPLASQVLSYTITKRGV